MVAELQLLQPLEMLKYQIAQSLEIQQTREVEASMHSLKAAALILQILLYGVIIQMAHTMSSPLSVVGLPLSLVTSEMDLMALAVKLMLKDFTYQNNIDKDPLFVDPDRGDYSLKQNSPAIDMGANIGRDGGNECFLNRKTVDNMGRVETKINGSS